VQHFSDSHLHIYDVGVTGKFSFTFLPGEFTWYEGKSSVFVA
jgi:hypothetical protein